MAAERLTDLLALYDAQPCPRLLEQIVQYYNDHRQEEWIEAVEEAIDASLYSERIYDAINLSYQKAQK